MHGVIQRPASSAAAYVRRRGSKTEVQWRTRHVANRARSRSRQNRRDARTHDLVEALVLIAVLTSVTAVMYVRAGHGGVGL